MKRPEFVTNEDLDRWSESIDNDENIPQEMANQPIIREACYAGLWLCEELDKLECPEEIRDRIQFTAGKLSWGRDIWQVHQDMLENYRTDQLEYEVDVSHLN